MKVYVAGAWCDKATVQQVQCKVRECGHRITHDWTVSPTARTALEDATLDYAGVSEADLVVLVFAVAEHAYRGTFTEMGIALGLRKKIIALRLCDGEYRHNPFLQLSLVRSVYSLQELLEMLLGEAHSTVQRSTEGSDDSLFYANMEKYLEDSARASRTRKYVPLAEDSDDEL